MDQTSLIPQGDVFARETRRYMSWKTSSAFESFCWVDKSGWSDFFVESLLPPCNKNGWLVVAWFFPFFFWGCLQGKASSAYPTQLLFSPMTSVMWKFPDFFWGSPFFGAINQTSPVYLRTTWHGWFYVINVGKYFCSSHGSYGI